jgi:hypothetical protein
MNVINIEFKREISIVDTFENNSLKGIKLFIQVSAVNFPSFWVKFGLK